MNKSVRTSFSESVDYANSWSSSWYAEDDTVTWKVVIGLVYGGLALVTILGNIMVIVAFAKDARINRKIGNWYIVNLSVCDLISGGVMSINVTWLLHPFRYWPFGEIPCKIWLCLDYIAVTVAVFNIIFISLDRYWLLTKKLAYPKYQTKRTATGFITFAWTFVIIYYGVVTFAWLPITGLEQQIDYSWNCELEANYNLKFQLFMIGAFFVLPLLTISFLNLTVYRNIRQRSEGFVQSKPIPTPEVKEQAITESNSNVTQAVDVRDGKATKGESLSMVSLRVQNRSPTDKAEKGGKPAGDKNKKGSDFNRHRKAAITLAILVGVFIVCWVPFYITVILGAVCKVCHDHIPFWTSWEVTSALLWCNSTINPFLYAATNPHFRQNFIKFLGLAKFMNKKDNATTSSYSTKVDSSI